MPLLLAAPDKFPGMATAAEVAGALCRGAAAVGWRCDPAPVTDGGEGILEALGGRLRRTRVQGPLGEVVDAEWRLLDGQGPSGPSERGNQGPSGPSERGNQGPSGPSERGDQGPSGPSERGDRGPSGPSERGDRGPSGSVSGVGRVATAVIEMARAAGLDLVGGPEWNDPLRASTAGVGQLIMAAVAAGARRVIVGAGGSATTDGGHGCLEALEPRGRLAGVELVVACDVTTRFIDAAAEFAAHKGATPKQVALLTRRLERLAQLYEDTYGVDVRSLAGSGAGGGLAGGLAAIGAELVAGFELVADALDLPARVEGADLVATGEGFLDEQSFSDKAVGGVLELAAAAGVPALVVASEILDGLSMPTGSDVAVVSLVEEFGRDRALSHTTACIEEVTRRHLRNAGR